MSLVRPGTPDTSSPTPQTRTTDLPMLAFRAAVAAKSFDRDNRTVDLTFSTGAAVKRYDWRTGTYYWEKLSLDPKHVRMERLNSGAPLLDTHSGWSLSSVLGVVLDDTATVDGKKGRATVQFSQREDVAPIVQDVEDGIIRNVSLGYVVEEYEEIPPKRKGDIPTRLAIDWTPYEVSLVPMPADFGAQVRSGKPGEPPTRPDVPLYPCRISVRSAAGDTPAASGQPKETVMDPITEERSEAIAEPPIVEAPPATRTSEPSPAPTDADLAQKAERARVQGIMTACRAARMTQEFQDKLISDGVSLVDAQTRVFDEMRKRGAESAGPQANTVRDVAIGKDPLLHVRAGIENAILHRVSPTMFKLEDVGRQYRGMNLVDIARTMLNATSVRTTSMSKSDIAATALGLTRRGGYHTTSDFADLLEGIVNKTLRAAFDDAPQTYKAIARQMSAPDFKNITLLQLGNAPALEQVLEHGEYKRGTIATGKEAFALKKYGKIFAITRETIVNDDVDAFSRVPMLFGRSARTLESDLVWGQITSNPQMGDGNNLFSAAHANLDTDADHIDIPSLSRARRGIRMQTDLDGETRLNLTPKYLLVPPSVETKAQQFVGQITPASAANANPFSGLLQVVSEPRLEDNSATAWYLAISPDQGDIVVYAYLEGQTGPVIESRLGFDIDGLEIKARHEFAAKVVDWRGIYKNPGDLDS